jgi:hypothetical protein
MTPNELTKAADAIIKAVLDTVKEAGEHGAPAGPMYLAFQQIGFDHDYFETMMAAMIKAGWLVKQNHCYFINKTRKGA